MAVRAMLARVARLEAGRETFLARRLGSFAEFECTALDGIASKRFDARDMPVVVASVRQWLELAL